MIIKNLNYFDLAQICDSGQCFRMKREADGHFSLIAGDRYLEIWQDGSQCRFDCDKTDFENFWKKYFDLESDYKGYREKISERDKYLKEAADFGWGIRILRQDLWEMIVSFLISQQNNIVRIRRCIQNICETYGDAVMKPAGDFYYTFPKPEVLAELDEEALKACNLGYRSKYVVRAAKAVVSGDISLEKILKMDYKKAREELMKFYGVGEKVADCICLFGLHQLDAFPVDTHIQQALNKYYPKGFPKCRYHGIRGVMQQYIFYYEFLNPTGR